jgi:hypothetical protein
MVDVSSGYCCWVKAVRAGLDSMILLRVDTTLLRSFQNCRTTICNAFVVDC